MSKADSAKLNHLLILWHVQDIIMPNLTVIHKELFFNWYHLKLVITVRIMNFKELFCSCKVACWQHHFRDFFFPQLSLGSSTRFGLIKALFLCIKDSTLFVTLSRLSRQLQFSWKSRILFSFNSWFPLHKQNLIVNCLNDISPSLWSLLKRLGNN